MRGMSLPEPQLTLLSGTDGQDMEGAAGYDGAAYVVPAEGGEEE